MTTWWKIRLLLVNLAAACFLGACQDESSAPNAADLPKADEAAFSDPIALQPEEKIYCAGARMHTGASILIALRLEDENLAPKIRGSDGEKINTKVCDLNNLTIAGVENFELFKHQLNLEPSFVLQIGNHRYSNNWKTIFLNMGHHDQRDDIQWRKEQIEKKCSGFEAEKDQYGFFRVAKDCSHFHKKKDRNEENFEGAIFIGETPLYVICHEPSQNYNAGRCVVYTEYRSQSMLLTFSANQIQNWKMVLTDVEEFLDERLVALHNENFCVGEFCKTIGR